MTADWYRPYALCLSQTWLFIGHSPYHSKSFVFFAHLLCFARSLNPYSFSYASKWNRNIQIWCEQHDMIRFSHHYHHHRSHHKHYTRTASLLLHIISHAQSHIHIDRCLMFSDMCKRAWILRMIIIIIFLTRNLMNIQGFHATVHTAVMVSSCLVIKWLGEENERQTSRDLNTYGVCVHKMAR